MKKIINSPESVVMEMCRGIVMAHPELELLPRYKVIKRKKMNPDKVTLISGGGSGHEPAHAGFVGTGMLDAAVCGDVFASPSQVQVYQAIKSTAGNKGTLLIIKNYSGDMMNFKNAAYMAQEDGIDVDYVKVDDDVAVKDSLYTVGRRGVAGTVLVHKVAGAAAEKGWSLAEVKKAAEHAAESVRSIGFALTSCTVPAKGTPTFDIGDNEMEYGVGIHGEPGIQREPAASADVLAERMVDDLLKEWDSTEGMKVTVLVNGFGATPLQELYLFNNSVVDVLKKRGIEIHRIFVGNYMTSIDMAGASLSLLKMDDQLEELLDSESRTPAFSVAGKPEPLVCPEIPQAIQQGETDDYAVDAASGDAAIQGDKITLNNILFLVDKMSEVIIKNEVPFCELDSHAGDGDFGMSVAKGFKQLKREWKELLSEHVSSIGDFLQACSMIIMEYCGGASGPIWGSAFRAAGRCAGDKKEVTAEEFAEMLHAVTVGIQKTGERSFGRGADIGDKTLMDAWIPCAKAWENPAGKSWKELFEVGARAAVEGADSTKTIVARMGRAGTVGERSIGYPDAVAYALGVIFTELSNAVK